MQPRLSGYSISSRLISSSDSRGALVIAQAILTSGLNAESNITCDNGLTKRTMPSSMFYCTPFSELCDIMLVGSVSSKPLAPYSKRFITFRERQTLHSPDFWEPFFRSFDTKLNMLVKPAGTDLVFRWTTQN